MTTVQEWIDLGKGLGIPGLFTVGLLYILWKVVKLIAGAFQTWIMPRAELVVQKHVKLVETLETSLAKIVETTAKNTELQLSHSHVLEKQSELLKELHHSLTEHHRFAEQLAAQLKDPRIST